MASKMELRPATLADVPALAALGRESFTAAFGTLYPADDLAEFLAEVHDERTIASEIANAEYRHRLAVAEDGSLLGYAKVRINGKLQALSHAADPLELSQLYCASGATGQGVGAALMEWVLAEATAGDHDAVILSVYSENTGAQRFYARYGFAKTADTTFAVGTQIDHEYLFEKSLGDAA